MSLDSLGNKTDLHVFHFRDVPPLGGDLDAAFTAREVVDWIGRFGIFDRFVLGNHPPTFFRISTKLPSGEYLDAISVLIESLHRQLAGPALTCATCPAACPLAGRSFPRVYSEGKSRRLYKGIECDFLIKKKGEIDSRPGETLLARYNPDISLIAFHFHNTLTYANRFEIAISDLVAALKWAIDSEMFNIIAHPFDVLGRIYQEDRRGFEKIADLARERKVAFEINADKGYEEEVIQALIKNDNLFSFGGDFHALSYWLKRDQPEADGVAIRDEDREALQRLLGLTAEVAEREKRYWRELDPLFWYLPYPSEEKRRLRNHAVRLYKRRHPNEETFKRGLGKVVAKFEPKQGEVVKTYLQELHKIYVKWGGAPRKDLRMRLEKYFLKAPLTKDEVGVYEQWLAKAYELGLKKEQLINSWDTSKLESFLKRKNARLAH